MPDEHLASVRELRRDQERSVGLADVLTALDHALRPLATTIEVTDGERIGLRSELGAADDLNLHTREARDADVACWLADRVELGGRVGLLARGRWCRLESELDRLDGRRCRSGRCRYRLCRWSRDLGRLGRLGRTLAVAAGGDA